MALSILMLIDAPFFSPENTFLDVEDRNSVTALHGSGVNRCNDVGEQIKPAKALAATTLGDPACY